MEFIQFLGDTSKEINEDELYVYLKLIHRNALEAIGKVNIERGLVKPGDREYKESKNKSLENFFNFIRQNNNTDHFKDVLSIFMQMLKSFDLKQNLDYHKVETNNKRNYIFNEFPLMYISNLKYLIYPEAYIACFSSCIDDPVMWSHYSKNHTGIACEFSIKENVENKKVLNLNGTIGYHADRNGHRDMKGFRPFEYEEVNYGKEFPKINFFENLGRLPMGVIQSEWYQDENDKSKLYDLLAPEEKLEQWRNIYWNNYSQSYLTKLINWQYENEYRIILHDSLGGHKELHTRKYSYNFDDLISITFGINTTIENKVKVLEIIQEKCKIYKRDDFQLYQMKYSSELGKIVQEKLNISSMFK